MTDDAELAYRDLCRPDLDEIRDAMRQAQSDGDATLARQCYLALDGADYRPCASAIAERAARGEAGL